jgi:hypothetical protein
MGMAHLKIKGIVAIRLSDSHNRALTVLRLLSWCSIHKATDESCRASLGRETKNGAMQQPCSSLAVER